MSNLILPGTANPADVLAGKTFSAGTNNAVSGTMPNRGSLIAQPGRSYEGGYYSGITTPSGYQIGETIPATRIGSLVVVDKTLKTYAGLMRMISGTEWRSCDGNGVVYKYTLSGDSVQEHWSYNSSSPIYSLTVDEMGNTYIGLNFGQVHKIGPTGVKLAAIPDGRYPGTMSDMACCSDGNIVAITSEGFLYKLATSLPNGYTWYHYASAGGPPGVSSPSLVVDGSNNVYFRGSTASVVRKLNAAGAVQWTNNAIGGNGKLWMNHATNELYFTPSESSMLYKIRPSDGAVLWSIDLNTDASVSNAQKIVGIDATDGYVYVLGTNDSLKRVSPSGVLEPVMSKFKSSSGLQGTQQGFYNGDLYLWSRSTQSDMLLICKTKITIK